MFALCSVDMSCGGSNGLEGAADVHQSTKGCNAIANINGTGSLSSATTNTTTPCFHFPVAGSTVPPTLTTTRLAQVTTASDSRANKVAEGGRTSALQGSTATGQPAWLIAGECQRSYALLAQCGRIKVLFGPYKCTVARSSDGHALQLLPAAQPSSWLLTNTCNPRTTTCASCRLDSFSSAHSSQQRCVLLARAHSA